jgi:hypothetical protein
MLAANATRSSLSRPESVDWSGTGTELRAALQLRARTKTKKLRI